LLSITAGFDSLVVTQVIDRYYPVSVDAPSVAEQDDPEEDDSDMLRPTSPPPLRRGDRKPDRQLAGAGGEERDGRRLTSCLAQLRARPCHAGCEHAHRNGLGFPLRC
jgi:hypothetical protein